MTAPPGSSSKPDPRSRPRASRPRSTRGARKGLPLAREHGGLRDFARGGIRGEGGLIPGGPERESTWRTQ